MADQRIQYDELMVGNGHPSLSDTLNRHANVEHNPDGTHHNITADSITGPSGGRLSIGSEISIQGTNIDANPTEMNYLVGTTAPIQAQLDAISGSYYSSRPNHCFNKIFAAQAGASQLRIVNFGDSVGQLKYLQYGYTLNRLMGCTYPGAGTNPSGTAIAASAGDVLYGNGAFNALTNQWSYWPTGSLTEITNGNSPTFLTGGANPLFTKIQFFYIKEPGGGNFDVKVNGVTVGSVTTANATISIGKFEYSQSVAQYSVSISCTSGSVKIAMAHFINANVTGIDYYNCTVGGISLDNCFKYQTSIDNFVFFLNAIGVDLFTFEMKEALTYPDGTTFSQRISQLCDILDASGLTDNSDVVLFGSTPVATGDADQITQNTILRNAAISRRLMYWDGYSPIGSYANMVTLGWQGDGVHPDTKASAYLAGLFLNDMGFNSLTYSWGACALNDRTRPSYLGDNTAIGRQSSRQVLFKPEPTFGFDWEIQAPRSVKLGESTYGTFGIHYYADGGGPKLGFNNTPAITKPTVTGSKGANAALTSLLTALANLGLITDSSS